jgi:ParB family chromosome partitioning protein
MTTAIKATSVGQAYKTQRADLDIKVNKTFMVPIEHLRIEDGFNVRDLDQEHIEAMTQSYQDGRMMPALVIRTTQDGFKVIDGHHRLSAAKIAGVKRLECKEFTGTEAEQIAYMVSSSQGRDLKPIERARAYRRMLRLGMTKDEIGDDVLQAIDNGEVSPTEVRKEMRKSGGEAQGKIMEAVKKARVEGGKAKLRSFTQKHYKKVMEILSGMEESVIGPELSPLVELWRSDSIKPTTGAGDEHHPTNR